MKRSLLGVCGVLLAATIGARADVTSVNVVGFNKLTFERGKLYLVATAFEDINGAVLHANDVLGTQVPSGTTINYYDGIADPSPYTTSIRAAFGANNGWGTNLVFHGFMGFWLKIPTGTGQQSYDVVLKGQVPMDATSSNLVVSGLNMLGFPYTADVVFSNTALYATSLAGDKLTFWDTTITNYVTYQKAAFGTNPWGPGRSATLRQGVGFWYKRNSGTPILDTELRPYPTN